MQFKKVERLYFILVITVCLVCSVWYLYWRLKYTLNPDYLFFSILVYAAELFGFCTWLPFIFCLWNPTDRVNSQFKEPLKDKSVDVFITCYKESAKLIEATIIGCKLITYPNTVYILDDGRSEEVKKLAEKYNFKYITRTTRKGYKAGNLNNALEQTKGDFILTLDADHMPQPNAIDKLIGYFDDEKVAFVQAPHEFYNLDSFQHKWNVRKFIVHEQSIFFRKIEPGKDRYNAAFYCGGSGMLRKKAVEDIGFFPEDTVTEDFHLSIRLHAKGWKSVYHNEPVAFGLAPYDIFDFVKQRIRWGDGTIQVFKKEFFDSFQKLNLQQKINYSSTIIGYFEGYQFLIFALAPVMYFLFRISPISFINMFQFYVYFLLYYFSMILCLKALTRPYGYNFFIWVMNVFRFPLLIISTFTLFTKKSKEFITAKKEFLSESPFSVLYSQMLIMLLYILAGTYAIINFRIYDLKTYIGTSIWFLMQLITLSVALVFAFRHGKLQDERREVFRFKVVIPFFMIATKVVIKDQAFGLIDNISQDGMRINTLMPCNIDEEITLEFKLIDRVIKAKGTVVNVVKDKNSKFFFNGILFTNLNHEDKEFIVRYCFIELIPRLFYPPQTEIHMFTPSIDYKRMERKLNLKYKDKVIFRYVCEKKSDFYIAEKVSEKGLSFRHKQPIQFARDSYIDFGIKNVPIVPIYSKKLKYNLAEEFITVVAFSGNM